MWIFTQTTKITKVSNRALMIVFAISCSLFCYSVCLQLATCLIRYWRRRGLKANINTDDGIVAVKGKDNARRESQMVRRDLQVQALWLTSRSYSGSHVSP